MLQQCKTLTTLFLVFSLCLLPLAAMAEAGKAIFVLGKAHVEKQDGAQLPLIKGSHVDEGDIIVTSKRGQVQLRMVDGTLLAVRPDSRFKIDDYQYKKDVKTDKSVYSLLKGGFRSITGAIGKEKKSAYGVKTIVGTIGIRGTDYSARLCSSDCDGNTNGLYVSVMQGGVILRNDGGDVSIDPGEYGFMQDLTVQPQLLEIPPGDLLFAQTTAPEKTTVVRSKSTGGNASQTASANTSGESKNTKKNDNAAAPVVAKEQSAAPENVVSEESNADVDSEAVLAANGIESVDAASNGIDDTDSANITLESEPEIATALTDESETIDFASGDLLLDDFTNTGLALPSSGTASYVLPTDLSIVDGNNTVIGAVQSGTTRLDVDFVSLTADSSIDVMLNTSERWVGDANGMAINGSDGSFSGAMTVNINDPTLGVSSGSGFVTGGLSSDADPISGAPSTANMDYQMTNATGSATLGGAIDLSLQ